MTTGYRNLGELTPKELSQLCCKYFDYVIGFYKILERGRPGIGFVEPMKSLDELKVMLENSTSEPFLDRSQIEKHCLPMVNQMIHWNGNYESQLSQFWRAYIDISERSTDPLGFRYNPRELLDENIRKIEEANAIFNHCYSRFEDNPTDKTVLYALFYAHILKVETVEYSLKTQLEQLLKKFNIFNKYDTAQIFSVRNKIPKKNEFRTDVRAIRDALTHHKYTLEDSNTVTIHFINDKNGYNFNQKYTSDEFLQFMADTELLYRSQINLIQMWIATAIIDSVFKYRHDV